MQYKLKMKRFLFLLLCSPTLPLWAAPHPPKEIAGHVRDAGTSEAIIGASVRIKDSVKGASTDMDGYYSIPGLTEEKCTLIISYISYKPVEIECELKENSTQIDVSMENDEITIGEIVVNARIRGNTETGLLKTIQSLPQIASGISAAQIAKSPDRIASEVIRRVPGISIIDDRFVIVRGLSQRYNNAWINGLAVPSTESDSRAFPFDLIPGSQIDRLLVYKSPSPEIPADFSGGFVHITSKSVPDENRMEFSYTGGFNTQTHFRNFRINPNKHTGDWSIRDQFPLPDQHVSLMIARRMETKSRQTIGNITALTYSNTFKGVEGMKNARYGIYSASADKPVFLDDYFDNQYSNDARLGLLHNWAFILNPSNRMEFKNLLNVLGRNRLTERSGIKDMSSMYYREQTEMLYSSRLTYSGQFSGTHDWGMNQSFAWDAGYSYANKNEPNRRIVTNHAGISNPEDIATVETGNDNITRYSQDLHDHNFSLSLNYKRTFHRIKFQPVLKAGFYGEYKTRNYTPREFIYRYDRLSYEERQTYLKLPFQEMLGDPYLAADKVYQDEITRKSNAYSANVWHGAGYAALEIPADKLTAYVGVRWEKHNTELRYDRSDAPELILKTVKKVAGSDWLPSLNLNYKWTDKQQLRAAYGRSLNRPELRELSPSVYFDFDLFSEIAGNENLKTAQIDNLELRYEFYPASGETVSFGVFYKHFKNPVEWTFIDMGGSLRYNYENADRAGSWGMELDLRKKLDFLYLPDFLLMLNVALIESRVYFKPGEVVSEPDRPMQGQSPYVVNAGLFYRHEKAGINASLLYNRIGKRIVGLGKNNSSDNNINALIPDSYEMPRNMLDFTVSKTLGKRLEIRCSVKDILSEDVIYKQFPKFEKEGVIYEREQITRKYRPGQSFSLGVSYKIN
jgi:outer membrane receptor protein involved in Fe transport